MLDKMYWVCADVLTLATQLATARDLPSPDILQRRIDTLFEQMAQKGREAGIADPDVADAKYALVAFIDEQIFRSPWPGRNQWMGRPLQLVYYNENTAGEGFFTRMQQLQNQPARQHVLEIYYLCVALGFQGMYAVRGDEAGLAAILERAGAQLSRQLPASDRIAPHGDPRDSGRNLNKRDAPLITLALICLALSVVAFVGLKLVLSASTSDAVEQMDKAKVSQQSTTK
ncbi:MAG: type IVB secretion system protein IcmH/DotU [Polyangiales bacterium]